MATFICPTVLQSGHTIGGTLSLLRNTLRPLWRLDLLGPQLGLHRPRGHHAIRRLILGSQHHDQASGSCQVRRLRFEGLPGGTCRTNLVQTSLLHPGWQALCLQLDALRFLATSPTSTWTLLSRVREGLRMVPVHPRSGLQGISSATDGGRSTPFHSSRPAKSSSSTHRPSASGSLTLTQVGRGRRER